jgi:hypothetical protein
VVGGVTAPINASIDGVMFGVPASGRVPGVRLIHSVSGEINVYECGSLLQEGERVEGDMVVVGVNAFITLDVCDYGVGQGGGGDLV